ncbi:BTAD domain-containing putative transcriptional regulator [Amycolatopsis sp. CA-128772]|uniref:nSTAND1 domain-containing NTPase n=1 Tax=Amycolatopsis sp. CA-128772 TaxID=2073159 RepID=UPI000CD109AA|nr:BTAD domain-containing putative transcriptional regulator [Amycolatopsis sp. CA-128772]
MDQTSIRIFGELEVVDAAGAQLRLRPMPLAVLAALVCLHPKPASAADLADWLWNEPPASNSLAKHLRAVRDALGTHFPGGAVRVASGKQHRLEADRSRVDYFRFGDHVEAARAAVRRGDHPQAHRELSAALAQVRGRPLENLSAAAANGRLWRFRYTLERQWREACLLHVECLLELGRHSAAYAETERHLAEWPQEENLLGLHATAMSVHRGPAAVEAFRGRLRAGDLLSDRLDAHLDAVLAVAPGARVPGWPSDRADLPPGACPYPGLAAFDRSLARYFFGRTELVGKLLDKLKQRLAVPEIVVVTAISGAGKSSLLQAGLLPALDRGALSERGNKARYVLFRPTSDPGGVLRAELAGLGAGPGRLVLVVDQFEETFTQCADEQERHAFIRALAELAAGAGDRPPAVVVLGVRIDFFDRCAEYQELSAALSNPFLVNAMTPGELREAIERPAKEAGLAWEPGLVDVLLKEFGIDGAMTSKAAYAAGQLPLLSHTLQAICDLRTGDTLTRKEYESVRGVRGAILTTVEGALLNLGAEEEAVMKRLLLRLVRIGEGAEHTRQRVDLSELRDEATRAALDRLAANRLVTVTGKTAEITHEALLREWPALQEWIRESEVRLFARQQLLEAATAWRRDGRHPGDLYRNPKLASVREWAGPGAAEADLPAYAAEFLEQSIVREDEVHAAERRRTRRRQQLVAALVTVAVLVVCFAGYSLVAWSRSVRQHTNSIADQAAGTALNELRSSDTLLGAQLALAAYRLSPTTAARSSLLSAFQVPYGTTLPGHTGSVNAVAYARNGKLLATAGDDHEILLWDTSAPRYPVRKARLPGHTDAVNAIAFSPDGRVLASSGAERGIFLWDVGDPDRPVLLTRLPGHAGAVVSLQFGRDGRTLASGSRDRTVRLWDVTPAHPHELSRTDLATGVRSVAFSPDARTLAAAGDDGGIRLLDVSAPGRPGAPVVVPGHTAAVESVAFSPDGRTLASVGDDSDVKLWDAGTPGKLRVLTAFGYLGQWMTAVAFSPDGRTLAFGGFDRAVTVMDVSDPAHTGPTRTVAGVDGPVRSLAFRPDGGAVAATSAGGSSKLAELDGPGLHHGGPVGIEDVAASADGAVLATAGSDTVVQIRDLGRPGPPVELREHRAKVLAVTFSRQGRLLATASDDGTAQLWDLREPGAPRRLGTIEAPGTLLKAVAFSPDDRTLAVAGSDEMVRLWDIGDPRAPQRIAELAGHSGEVESLSYSPDGRTLASGGLDATVRLWDVSSPHAAKLRVTLTGHRDYVWAVAFSPDGKVLATGGTDKDVLLWDVGRPGEVPKRLSELPHPGPVSSIAFGPAGGHRLVTADDDHVVRLWDITEPGQPELLSNLYGHGDRVTSVAFVPDGHTVVSGGRDGTALVWETDPERLARRVCAETAGVDARFVWNRYYGGDPFRPGC